MTDPIQQQLIAARKSQILDAATTVFAQKGYHPTTIRDIAKEAGISDGTIYNYFKNKPALILAIFDRMQETILQARPPQAAMGDVDFRTFIRGFLAHPLRALEQDEYALFRVIISEMMVNEELRQLYYEKILQPTMVVAETYLQQHPQAQHMSLDEVRLTIRALSGMVMGLILEHSMGDPVLRERWDDLPDVLTNFVINGFTHYTS